MQTYLEEVHYELFTLLYLFFEYNAGVLLIFLYHVMQENIQYIL